MKHKKRNPVNLILTFKANGESINFEQAFSGISDQIIFCIEGQELNPERQRIDHKISDSLKLVSTFYNKTGGKLYSTEIGYEVAE